MNQCNHDFTNFDSEAAPDEKLIVCVYCGQVRHIKVNGDVEVMKDHGTVSWQKQTD